MDILRRTELFLHSCKAMTRHSCLCILDYVCAQAEWAWFPAQCLPCTALTVILARCSVLNLVPCILCSS